MIACLFVWKSGERFEEWLFFHYFLSIVKWKVPAGLRPWCLEEPKATKTEQSMEEESFMQLNYKDMKKWYNDNAEMKEK